MIERYLDNLNFIIKKFSPEINHYLQKSQFSTVLINTNHPIEIISDFPGCFWSYFAFQIKGDIQVKWKESANVVPGINFRFQTSCNYCCKTRQTKQTKSGLNVPFNAPNKQCKEAVK